MANFGIENLEITWSNWVNWNESVIKGAWIPAFAGMTLGGAR